MIDFDLEPLGEWVPDLPIVTDKAHRRAPLPFRAAGRERGYIGLRALRPHLRATCR